MAAGGQENLVGAAFSQLLSGRGGAAAARRGKPVVRCLPTSWPQERAGMVAT